MMIASFMPARTLERSSFDTPPPSARRMEMFGC